MATEPRRDRVIGPTTVSIMNDPLRILALNISGPSARRAADLLTWLRKRSDDVLVLSETRPGRGHDVILETLRDSAYAVQDSNPTPTGRGVLVASRVPLSSPYQDPYRGLDGRAVSVLVQTESDPVEIVGVYAPSSPPDGVPRKPDSVERKRDWLDRFTARLEESWPAPRCQGSMCIGDFNVIPPDHQPRYKSFQKFEYEFFSRLITRFDMRDVAPASPSGRYEHTWRNHNGDGYRFDHALVDLRLRERVASFEFVHETRSQRISDHSALAISLNIPVTRVAPLEPQPALF